MKSFFAAVRFLTVLPVPERWCGGEETLAGSVKHFPLIGLLIGGAVCLVDAGLAGWLPPAPRAVIVVLLFIGVSGGLHVDGLADTADGFLSSRPRERILEIMRDSRSGPMAIVALIGIILLKVVCLAGLPSSVRGWAILLMPLAGRCAAVIQMSGFPYARSSGGLAGVFCRKRSVWNAVWAVVLLVAVGAYAGRAGGLWAAGGSVAVALLFSFWCYRKIGGFTGDTLGAACEVAEVVPVLVAAALAR